MDLGLRYHHHRAILFAPHGHEGERLARDLLVLHSRNAANALIWVDHSVADAQRKLRDGIGHSLFLVPPRSKLRYDFAGPRMLQCLHIFACVVVFEGCKPTTPEAPAHQHSSADMTPTRSADAGPFRAWGDPIPKDAARIELLGGSAKLGGKPLGELRGVGRALLITDFDTFLAEAAPVLGMLDRSAIETWLVHPAAAVAAVVATPFSKRERCVLGPLIRHRARQNRHRAERLLSRAWGADLFGDLLGLSGNPFRGFWRSLGAARHPIPVAAH